MRDALTIGRHLARRASGECSECVSPPRAALSIEVTTAAGRFDATLRHVVGQSNRTARVAARPFDTWLRHGVGLSHAMARGIPFSSKSRVGQVVSSTAVALLWTRQVAGVILWENAGNGRRRTWRRAGWRISVRRRPTNTPCRHASARCGGDVYAVQEGPRDDAPGSGQVNPSQPLHNEISPERECWNGGGSTGL